MSESLLRAFRMLARQRQEEGRSQIGVTGFVASVTEDPGSRGEVPPTLVTKPAFLARIRREAVETGVDARRATEGAADVVDTTSRSPTERNEARMPVSAAAAEAWREIRAEAPSLPVPLVGMFEFRRDTPFSLDEKTRSVPPLRGPPPASSRVLG